MILLTGGSGKLGSLLKSSLEARGEKVLSIGRSSQPAFDLREEQITPELKEALKRSRILVHAGWDLSTTPLRDRAQGNIEGSRRLIHAAREAGVQRIVFISSTLARADSVSFYGRAKREVERMLSSTDLALRVGLVIQPEGQTLASARGLGARLIAKVGRILPVLPWIGGRAEVVYCVSQSEFVRCTTQEILSETAGIAYLMEGSPLSAQELLTRVIGGRIRPVVFVPPVVSWLAWRTFGMDPQKLDSLRDLRQIHIESDARMLL
jgi:uncharacterized protein YbjT (DUF2867 family)